jgi:phosphoribosylaminoimidazolecarboxamide formyltransferase/IMP cyclohydrolase
MKDHAIAIKRALISVSDKKNLLEFARGLVELNVEIISTGGTAKLLRENNIAVQDVADVTQFPEMMDGRVKTLHPRIHGGILGKRDEHEAVAKQHEIQWIDLVVVNLYPFKETIQKPDCTFDDAIENIDIGGPAMIRSAAKNMEWTSVVVDPDDYENILKEIRAEKKLSFAARKKLAAKAFQHTAEYDRLIADYLIGAPFETAAERPPQGERLLNSISVRPEERHVLRDGRCAASSGRTDMVGLEGHLFKLKKLYDLRYGENPHQSASAYIFPEQNHGILSATQHQGKELSFNNIADADAAWACVQEFFQPACVVVKHANPCGASVAENIDEAFQKAFEADSQSAFGGIIALNRPCTKKIADYLSTIFIEVLVAPAYENEALEIFSKKSNLRILELNNSSQQNPYHYKFVEGGILIQDKDAKIIEKNHLTCVTQRQPTDEEMATMLFAWPVLKHIKSNGILIAKNNVTVGVGAGQVSRIDAVDIAVKKAGKNLANAILASDAFFPFRDSIDRIAQTGMRAIIQPGGSVKDPEVIAACNEHNIAMVFTGVRCFRH